MAGGLDCAQASKFGCSRRIRLFTFEPHDELVSCRARGSETGLHRHELGIKSILDLLLFVALDLDLLLLVSEIRSQRGKLLHRNVVVLIRRVEKLDPARGVQGTLGREHHVELRGPMVLVRCDRTSTNDIFQQRRSCSRRLDDRLELRDLLVEFLVTPLGLVEVGCGSIGLGLRLRHLLSSSREIRGRIGSCRCRRELRPNDREDEQGTKNCGARSEQVFPLWERTVSGTLASDTDVT